PGAGPPATAAGQQLRETPERGSCRSPRRADVSSRDVTHDLCVLGLYGGDNPIDEDRVMARHDYRVGHSANAAVVCGTEILAACAQERLDRIKHSNKAPMLAARTCLARAGLSFADV